MRLIQLEAGRWVYPKNVIAISALEPVLSSCTDMSFPPQVVVQAGSMSFSIYCADMLEAQRKADELAEAVNNACAEEGKV